MTLPAQAREAAEKARQMQEGLNKPTEPEAVVTEPATPDNQATPATPEPVARPLPQTDWEQRYKTLQGMFNSTVPKLQAELREAKQQIESLRQAPAPAPQPFTTTPSITQNDVEEFGQETIDMMRRAARQEAQEQFAPIIAQLQQQLQALQTTVVPKVTEIAHETETNKVNRFVQQLDQSAPNWRALNNDDAFLNWLDVIDPLAGMSRQQLLDTAVKAQDAVRAAAFFNAYVRETSVPTPTPAPTPTVNPQLEALVAPGKGRGGAPPSNEKPPVTRDFIAKFYNDVAAGKYRNRPDEKAKIESDIFAAQREGRVTP